MEIVSEHLNMKVTSYCSIEYKKHIYADILYLWQLLSVRALVMKSVKSANTEPHKGMEFKSECGQCKTSTFGKICLMCKLPTMYCVICRLSGKG